MSRLNLRFYRVLILVLLTTWIVRSHATAELLTESVPFVAPEGEYVTTKDRDYRFRIPGMIVALDGAILVFAEGLRGDGSDPRTDENAPIDLAPAVGADLAVMERDSRMMRGNGPFILAQVNNGVGVREIADHVLSAWRTAKGAQR